MAGHYTIWNTKTTSNCPQNIVTNNEIVFISPPMIQLKWQLKVIYVCIWWVFESTKWQVMEFSFLKMGKIYTMYVIGEINSQMLYASNTFKIQFPAWFFLQPN